MSPPLFKKYLVRNSQKPGTKVSDQDTDLVPGAHCLTKETVARMLESTLEGDPLLIRQGSDREAGSDRLSVGLGGQGQDSCRGDRIARP